MYVLLCFNPLPGNVSWHVNGLQNYVQYWSISAHLPGMTDHKCAWLVGMTNQQKLSPQRSVPLSSQMLNWWQITRPRRSTCTWSKKLWTAWTPALQAQQTYRRGSSCVQPQAEW